MKRILLVGFVLGVLTGCTRKATPCDSQYMRGKMNSAFVEAVNYAYAKSDIDLFAAGLVSNVRFDNIETDFKGGNGNAAVCRARIRIDVADTTIEDEFGYLVVSQSGKDLFRKTSRWPMAQLDKLLMTGPMGELREKEREVFHLRFELTPDERAALGDSHAQKVASAEAALEMIRARIKNRSVAPRASSNQ